MCYLVATLKTKTLSTHSTVSSPYLIIKLVHGQGGHGVAVGLCPIPMAVLGVGPLVGVRAEVQAVLAGAVLIGVHHVHWSRPRGDPGLVWGKGRWGLPMYSPFCK